MANKLYFITGASSGLGLAIADNLLEDNENVVVNLSRSNAPQTYNNLVNCNIDFAHVSELEQQIIDLLDSYKFQNWLEITLINSAAAIKPISNITDIPTDDLIVATNINHIAPVILFKNFLKIFSGRNNLTLVNVSSGAANANISGWATYSCLKAANNRFVENMADEYRDNTAIKFMIFNPGIMDTPMQAEIRSAEFRDREKFVEFKKSGSLRPPEVVANHLVGLLLQKQFDLHESM